MKIFKRHRSVQELSDACAKNNWPLYTEEFDLRGSDYISFRFNIPTPTGPVTGLAIFNTFNGRMHGELSDGSTFNSSHEQNEDCLWFQLLLEFAYTNQPIAAQ